MNAVDVEAEVNAIAHLDFEPRCEVVDSYARKAFGILNIQVLHVCERQAVAGVLCKTCANRCFVCEQHSTDDDDPVICGRCGAQGRLSEVMVVVPLGGA